MPAYPGQVDYGWRRGGRGAGAHGNSERGRGPRLRGGRRELPAPVERKDSRGTLELEGSCFHVEAGCVNRLVFEVAERCPGRPCLGPTARRVGVASGVGVCRRARTRVFGRGLGGGVWVMVKRNNETRQGTGEPTSLATRHNRRPSERCSNHPLVKDCEALPAP
jgi:hypothetical protein